MALRDRLKKFTATPAQLDQAKLKDFCANFPDARPIAELAPRERGTVVGEIRSWRIVPKADGSPWLEAVISDGSGTVVAMWTGRKRIAGIHEGRRLMITGRGHATGRTGRIRLMNPRYQLL